MKNVSKIQLLALSSLIGLSNAQINAQSFLTRYKKPILISIGVAATVISAIYGFKSKKQNNTNSDQNRTDVSLRPALYKTSRQQMVEHIASQLPAILSAVNNPEAKMAGSAAIALGATHELASGVKLINILSEAGSFLQPYLYPHYLIADLGIAISWLVYLPASVGTTRYAAEIFCSSEMMKERIDTLDRNLMFLEFEAGFSN